MKKKRGINLLGLHEKPAGLAKTLVKPVIPWGMTAKGKDELKKPRKALAAKKKQRKMVQGSRRGNR